MAIKKWNSLFFIVFISIVGCNERSKHIESKLKYIEPDTVIFSKKIDVSGIAYNYSVILSDSLDHQKLCWKNLSSNKSICYVQDELYIEDSIVDINGDYFHDLCVDYQSNNGKVKFVHLFKNELKTFISKPIILHNYSAVTDTTFFEIYPQSTIYEFKKFEWKNDTIVFIEKVFADISNGINQKLFFNVIQNDSIMLERRELKEEDLLVIDSYFSDNF